VQRQHDKVGRQKMKTKALIAMCVLFIGFNASNAQTNVSGLISANTTWSLAGNPYIVVGNTMVDEGVTLIIDAGVTIRFDELMALQINGELKARGNSSSKITFTSNSSNPTAGDWGFVMFSDASSDAVYDVDGNYNSGSILEYSVVEFGGGGINTTGAVMVDNAHPFIHECTIQHNDASGINGINLTGTLKITQNIISNNAAGTGGGICISGGYVIISDNYISDNSATGMGNYGGGGIFTIWNTSEIYNNYIINNAAQGYGAGGGGGGIYVREGNSTISGNIIRNNKLIETFMSDGGGVLIYLSYAIISNNAITHNKGGWGAGIYGGNEIFNNSISENTAYRSGGIHSVNNIYNNSIINNTAENAAAVDPGNDISGIFSHNTITGNTATDTVPLYTVRIATHPLFNYNNIYNNATTYELINANDNTTANLDAGNNWWGTSSEAEVQGKIFDWFDDASAGIVSYSPFSTSIITDAPVSPPAELNIAASPGQISLSWLANTESDIAGYNVYWGTTNDYPYENSLDAGDVTSFNIDGLSQGTYYATVTAYDNSADTVTDDPGTIVNEKQCAGNESWYAKAVSTLGINEPVNDNETQVVVFPNPTSSHFTITIPPSATQIQIVNSLGQLVITTEVEGQSNYSFELTESGIYFIQVITYRQIMIRKIIVNK
jgi:putative cofactor-binding repeat protein